MRAMAASAVWLCAGAAAAAVRTPTVEDLQELSIEQLSDIMVTSVSKAPESISDAPASIYVISHDDIIRSGAVSIPEILRLAPNLQVDQTSASHYVITARGFSGNAGDQNFSDKLLVLIDGRSVYTLLYSGVYWDMQDVPPDDIERIEVISGPGATLWGANAVNGVINIITRKAADTAGALVDVGAGALGWSTTLQYGGKLGSDLNYRVYAKTFRDADTVTSTGAPARDHWSKPQGGFRFDWTPSGADTVTLQGDTYSGNDAQGPGSPDEHINGRNLMLRWDRVGAGGSDLQVQTYYDRTGRSTLGTGNFTLDTYDVDVQESFPFGPRNQVVLGGGYRYSRYNIASQSALLFVPPGRHLDLANGFVEDTLSVTSALKLTLAAKLEDDPFSGTTLLPTARASWKLNPTTLLWATASRAIRSPTPFDVDVQEKVGSTVFLSGDPDFRSETVTAYEIGVRLQPTSRLSVSASTFYNIYDDLKTLEPTPVSFTPLHWDNLMRGYTSGVEAWADYQLTTWWRLSGSFNSLQEHLKFKPGSLGLLGVSQSGDDPKNQASIKSSMNLGRALTLDADVRYVSGLPEPRVPAYVELNGRIGWNVSDHLQLSLSGFNLLHERHMEFPAPQANAVPRTYFVELRWRH